MHFAGDGKLRRNNHGIGNCGLLAHVRHNAAVHWTFRRNAGDRIGRSGSGRHLIYRGICRHHALAMALDRYMSHSMARCPAAVLHAGFSQQRQHQRKNQRQGHRDGNHSSHYERELYPQFISKARVFSCQAEKRETPKFNKTNQNKSSFAPLTQRGRLFRKWEKKNGGTCANSSIFILALAVFLTEIVGNGCFLPQMERGTNLERKSDIYGLFMDPITAAKMLNWAMGTLLMRVPSTVSLLIRSPKHR